MKKTLLIFALALALLFPSSLWSAVAPGSCTQTQREYTNGSMFVVRLACTGSVDDGSIPNTAISSAVITSLTGKYYLYTISAYPTSGGTAPDAADVFVLDANLEDLLGSVDGGTTANKGANLIHATLKKTTMPYSNYLSSAYFPSVLNTLTLKVSNQATVSANFTIELVFVR